MVAMARATSMFYIFAACAMLSIYTVRAATITRTFEVYAHVYDGDKGDIQVFGNKSNGKGSGYIYENRMTKTKSSDSELYAKINGLYFAPQTSFTQEIASIQFEDINEKGGRFANAQVHLRGTWFLDEDDQEFAIVGGSKGLAGAYGYVTYTKVAHGVYFVQGKFSINTSSDEEESLNTSSVVEGSINTHSVEEM